MNRFTLKERLIPLLSSKRDLRFLVDRLGESASDIKSLIMDLQYEGYNIKMWKEDKGFGEQVMFHIEPTIEREDTSYTNYPEGIIEALSGGYEFKIALVSDNHGGSEKEALEELHLFYDYAISQGVTEFYHAGDITDGWYTNRPASIFEQKAVGFQQQLDHIVFNYPKRDGITTYFITGNHDVTHLRNGGADIGRMISLSRPDLIYLGHNFAKVWLTDKVDLNLVHPTDGGAYSISYKMQKFIDGATGAKKSKILAMGHYHKMNWVYWKGTHGFTMPSFQHQTQFMSDNGLDSYVGGYILTIKVDSNEELLTVTPEFVDLSR